ncbi:MAG: hypothetical protein AAF690_09295, partial [Acidobacteriota bacterium]
MSISKPRTGAFECFCRRIALFLAIAALASAANSQATVPVRVELTVKDPWLRKALTLPNAERSGTELAHCMVKHFLPFVEVSSDSQSLLLFTIGETRPSSQVRRIDLFLGASERDRPLRERFDQRKRRSDAPNFKISTAAFLKDLRRSMAGILSEKDAVVQSLLHQIAITDSARPDDRQDMSDLGWRIPLSWQRFSIFDTLTLSLVPPSDFAEAPPNDAALLGRFQMAEISFDEPA